MESQRESANMDLNPSSSKRANDYADHDIVAPGFDEAKSTSRSRRSLPNRKKRRPRGPFSGIHRRGGRRDGLL
jgi:hypothetical protein